MTTIKVTNAIDCETMDSPPVGFSDLGDDGFNINIDQMEVDKWYTFKDFYGKKVSGVEIPNMTHVPISQESANVIAMNRNGKMDRIYFYINPECHKNFLKD